MLSNTSVFSASYSVCFFFFFFKYLKLNLLLVKEVFAMLVLYSLPEK